MPSENSKCTCSFCTHRREIARLREELRQIGEMAGAKANGKDARAMAERARKALTPDAEEGS